MLNTETPLRQCTYHIKCKYATDPEHRKLYVCKYQKPCIFGQKCNKMEEPEHCEYYSHLNPLRECRYGQKCHHLQNPEHCEQYSHNLQLQQPTRKKTVFQRFTPPTETFTVTAKFTVTGDNEKLKVSSTGELSLEVAKNLSEDKVRALFLKKLQKMFTSLRFVNRNYDFVFV